MHLRINSHLTIEISSPLYLQPDNSDAELVGYTWPHLVSVIPWFKYEAQNMMELTWRLKFQCMREDDHI